MYVPRIGLAHMLESLNLIDLYTLFSLQPQPSTIWSCSPCFWWELNSTAFMTWSVIQYVLKAINLSVICHDNIFRHFWLNILTGMGGVLVNPFMLLTSLLWLCWFRAIKVETVDSLNFKAGCIQANYLNGGVRLYKLIVWLVTNGFFSYSYEQLCEVFTLGGTTTLGVEPCNDIYTFFYG